MITALKEAARRLSRWTLTQLILAGLTVDPDPIDPVVLDLPMPFSGDRSDFDEFLIDNLSQHGLANLPSR
jgi:hypothetical protein